ncbi:hypothetical protein E2C01_078876 [Portunus trituberculatus]|uniref:Uncharacterized protein n=1 Tax=Portunus trituberculatus TaxID=210409 RepID=A0A5B7IU32_PORTR|nr:hypothetical protein [Portunus trituberculatus]
MEAVKTGGYWAHVELDHINSLELKAANSHTPPSSQDGLDSDAAVRTAFTRRGISSEVAPFFLQSWRSSTKA